MIKLIEIYSEKVITNQLLYNCPSEQSPKIIKKNFKFKLNITLSNNSEPYNQSHVTPMCSIARIYNGSSIRSNNALTNNIPLMFNNILELKHNWSHRSVQYRPPVQGYSDIPVSSN